MKSIKPTTVVCVAMGALCLFSQGLPAQDAGLVVVLKEQEFFQSGPAAPGLRDDRPSLGFWALVEPSAAGSILSASVDLAGGGTQPLVFEANDNQFRFEDSFERIEDLAAAYPDGDYTLHLDTQNDGLQTLTVNLSGDNWTSAARVANLPALQGFDATQDFTLQWDPMVGGTVDDLIIVSIYSNQDGREFGSGGPGEPNSLDGTAESIVIPAGTFNPGEALEVEIDFVRLVDSTPSYSGAFAAYLKITRTEGRTLGGAEAIPPQLTQSIPRQDQGEVTRDAVTSFTFSEPMQTGIAIDWTGANDAAFAYTWSPDGRTLFCHYNADLPGNTLISYVLNPGGQPIGFRDLAGNPLPEQQGHFTTGPGTSTTGSDLKLLLLGKGRLYHQTGTVPSGPGTVGAFLTADFRSLNAVTNGLITLPNSRTAAIEYNGDHAGLEMELTYGNQSDLDLFFPGGDYVVDLDTIRDGARSVTLTLGGDQYPDAPTVIDLAAAQVIDTDQEVQINWQSFSGGTATDFIMFELESEYGQTVFSSPDPGQPGALDGTATGIQIPVGRLAPGRTYTVNLAFLKVVDQDTTSYAGATYVAGYFAETEFTISTTGSVQGPVWANLVRGGSDVQVELGGDAGVPYIIESTSDFGGWNFEKAVQFEPGAKTYLFSHPTGEGPGNFLFFRAREGNPSGGEPL